MTPYEERYEAATDRLLSRRKRGLLTEEAFTVRLARVRERRDEEAAKWARLDRLNARTTYRHLSPAEKVRARLAFRASRPRATQGDLMNPIDTAASEISAHATRLDVAAAKHFLNVNAAEGRTAAMDTSGAGHLIRKYKINRNLGAICRRIVADHEETR